MLLNRTASTVVGGKGDSLAKAAGSACQSGRRSQPLVQVVGGKGNPLARAAARGEAGALAPRLPAARCDLAALQALAALDPLALCERELSCGGASRAAPRESARHGCSGTALCSACGLLSCGGGCWRGCMREQRWPCARTLGEGPL